MHGIVGLPATYWLLSRGLASPQWSTAARHEPEDPNLRVEPFVLVNAWIAGFETLPASSSSGCPLGKVQNLSLLEVKSRASAWLALVPVTTERVLCQQPRCRSRSSRCRPRCSAAWPIRSRTSRTTSEPANQNTEEQRWLRWNVQCRRQCFILAFGKLANFSLQNIACVALSKANAGILLSNKND